MYSDNEKIIKRQEEVAREQAEALNEVLQKGVAFEELIRSSGWKSVIAHYENKIRAFSNRAILSGFTDINELNLERGKILGIQEVLNMIDASIKRLQDERTKGSSTTTGE